MHFFLDWRVVALLLGVALGVILAVIFYVKYKFTTDKLEKSLRDNGCLCARLEQMNIELNRYRAKIKIGGMSDEELVDDIVDSLDRIYSNWDGTGGSGSGESS
jgi:uncharacterized membrane-anchored protein YhcB (DUF1043 family)